MPASPEVTLLFANLALDRFDLHVPIGVDQPDESGAGDDGRGLGLQVRGLLVRQHGSPHQTHQRARMLLLDFWTWVQDTIRILYVLIPYSYSYSFSYAI